MNARPKRHQQAKHLVEYSCYLRSYEASRCGRCITALVHRTAHVQIVHGTQPVSCALRLLRINLPDHGAGNDVVLVDDGRRTRLLEQHPAQIVLT